MSADNFLSVQLELRGQMLRDMIYKTEILYSTLMQHSAHLPILTCPPRSASPVLPTILVFKAMLSNKYINETQLPITRVTIIS